MSSDGGMAQTDMNDWMAVGMGNLSSSIATGTWSSSYERIQQTILFSIQMTA